MGKFLVEIRKASPITVTIIPGRAPAYSIRFGSLGKERQFKKTLSFAYGTPSPVRREYWGTSRALFRRGRKGLQQGECFLPPKCHRYSSSAIPARIEMEL